MANPGRPAIPYDKFVAVWEQLISEGRASLNNTLELLGGNKSTFAGYRERYEREQAARQRAILTSIELSDAVHQAIAGIKVKEKETLEKENKQLKSRIDDHLALVKETEEKLASAKVDLEDAKVNFDIKLLSLERKLAKADARIEDMAQREQTLLAKNEEISRQYNQAKQAAAVAQKEVDMLREQKENS